VVDLNCPVFRQALTNPDAVALEADQRKISYVTLHELAQYLINLFDQRGIKPGDVIGAIAGNDVDAIVLAIACWRTGVIFAPFNLRWRAHQIDQQLQSLQPDWLWLADRQKSHFATDKFKAFEFELPVSISTPADAIRRATLPDIQGPNCPVDLIQTSGSLGCPKFVAHSLGNHLASASASAEIIDLNENNAWLLSLPLYHIAGLAIVVRCFAAGARVVLINERQNWMQPINTGAVSHVSLVPAQLWHLLESLDQPRHQLQAVLLGGGPVSMQLLSRAWNAGLHCYSSYGMTETSSQVFTIDHGAPRCSPGVENDGRFLDGFACRCDEQRQILVKGKALALGYWQNGGVVDFCDQQGWFATGDLGAICNGQLTISGRKDNIFVCGGENLQPEIIEKIISSHPAVKRALVVAIDEPRWGQVPVVFIDSDGLNDAEFDCWLDCRLNGLQKPRARFPWHLVVMAGNKTDRLASTKIASDFISGPDQPTS